MQITIQPALRRVLALDAGGCAAMGVALAAAAGPLAGLTGLPVGLLFGVGLVLLPVALFVAAFALRERMPVWALRVIVLGNSGWVVASLGLLALTTQNAIVIALVLAQAAFVAVLTAVEAACLPPRTCPSL